MSLNVEKFRKMKLSSFNREDVIKIMMDEFNVDINNFVDSYLYDKNLKSENYVLESCVDYYGGEGMGDDYWSVSALHNKQTDEYTFIKFYGYYESYNGVYWEDWRLSNPEIIEVISW